MTELEQEVHDEVVDALAVLAMHKDLIEDNWNMALSLKTQAARCRRILEERGEPARPLRPPVAAKPPAPPPPPPTPPPVAARVQEVDVFGPTFAATVYDRRKADVVRTRDGVMK
jgi:hypothetical protein